eukprot:COSAG02_NODE_10069_length_2034_cov_1.202067_2_plen_154_part_00
MRDCYICTVHTRAWFLQSVHQWCTVFAFICCFVQGYIADTTSISLLAVMCAGMGFLAGVVFLCCMPKGRIDGSIEADRGGRRSRRSLALPRRRRVDTDSTTSSSRKGKNEIYTELGSDDEDGGGDNQALLGDPISRTDRGDNGSSACSAKWHP